MGNASPSPVSLGALSALHSGIPAGANANYANLSSLTNLVGSGGHARAVNQLPLYLIPQSVQSAPTSVAANQLFSSNAFAASNPQLQALAYAQLGQGFAGNATGFAGNAALAPAVAANTGVHLQASTLNPNASVYTPLGFQLYQQQAAQKMQAVPVAQPAAQSAALAPAASGQSAQSQQLLQLQNAYAQYFTALQQAQAQAQAQVGVGGAGSEHSQQSGGNASAQQTQVVYTGPQVLYAQQGATGAGAAGLVPVQMSLIGPSAHQVQQVQLQPVSLDATDYGQPSGAKRPRYESSQTAAAAH